MTDRRLSILLLAIAALVFKTPLAKGQVCQSVPANASGGVSFGQVVAGQSYLYQASGCTGHNIGTGANAHTSDPDGNVYSNNCTALIGQFTYTGSFMCPGLVAYSLVGKINGGACIQLGQNGTFVAPTSGELVLYENDDIYSDNSGSWNVCITPVSQTCSTVPANASGGISFGPVVAGQTYIYHATGCAGQNIGSGANMHSADPDGNVYSNGCSSLVGQFTYTGSFKCPGLIAFSLVGKINGGACIQLGKDGSFIAPSSGNLVLYLNDDNYSDNSGLWSVCLSTVHEVSTNASCGSVPANASGGVSFGTVLAGQTYQYQASGCTGHNIGSGANAHTSDPDGNVYSNNCTSLIGQFTYTGSFTCPGLIAFSLVGKINGGACIQLGQNGTFVAPTTGQLVLYENDDNYSDNSGSWNVCVTPVSQACSNVPANAADGVPFGDVVAGLTYTYHATGCAGQNIGNGADAHSADPDGNVYSNGCASLVGQFTYTGSFKCPGLVAFSLVGKINGGTCIQLGKDGSFVAPSSGPLVLYMNDDNYSDNSGSWSVCLSSGHQVNTNAACTSIPANASGGVSFGPVVAGKTYAYQASGCAGQNIGSGADMHSADPDGNVYSNGCTALIGQFTYNGNFLCPGLTAFSLVGKIDGGTCIQLGKNGSFVAPSSGNLVLYLNDDIYSDNSGSWNVCVTPIYQVCSNIPANASFGVSFGNVVAGQMYTYHATGCAGQNMGTGADMHSADPDGNVYSNGCSSLVGQFTYTGSFLCPGLTAFSLVGKINGGACIQLGKDGTFVAPSSGELVLYLNDDNYFDNTGSWDVCITGSPEAITNVQLINNDVCVTWKTIAGRTYYLQSATNMAGNGFMDISPGILTPSIGATCTNYVISGGATNGPSGRYRIRIAP